MNITETKNIGSKSLSNVKKLTISGVIIALYVVVVFFTQGFSFGQYQIRIATSIYALAAIYPFLIIPLGIANFLSNTLMGGLGILDMIGGLAVGLITASGCYYFKKINSVFAGLPILLFPTLLVPMWLSYIIHVPYSILVLSIGIGQVIPSIAGVLIIKYFEKSRFNI